MDVSGGCDCSTSLAGALGGSAAGDGKPVEVAFCFWCGQATPEPELAEEARFRRRSSAQT
jgi:hypothetical protein